MSSRPCAPRAMPGRCSTTRPSSRLVSRHRTCRYSRRYRATPLQRHRRWRGRPSTNSHRWVLPQSSISPATKTPGSRRSVRRRPALPTPPAVLIASSIGRRDASTSGTALMARARSLRVRRAALSNRSYNRPILIPSRPSRLFRVAGQRTRPAGWDTCACGLVRLRSAANPPPQVLVRCV